MRVIQMLLDGLSADTTSTKRDLYYRDVNLFRKQLAVDTVRSARRSRQVILLHADGIARTSQMIDDIAATLRVRRSDLGVVATSKGLFAGPVQLALKDGSTLSGAQTVRFELMHSPIPDSLTMLGVCLSRD